MPEIIISPQSTAADVIKALQENDQVLLKAAYRVLYMDFRKFRRDEEFLIE